MTNIPIFLASDNNYAPFVASTVASICDNTKSFVDIYVLDGGITKENKTKIEKLKDKFDNFSIEFLEIDIEKEFSSINYKNKSSYVSLSTYNRFLIPQLKPGIDKALYSDVDVIFMGDISKMYNEDLDGYSLGAVWEEYCEFSYNASRKMNLNLNDNHKYFSAGNLLINCKQWRDNNITKKLFQLEKKYRDILDYADMDILNKFFDNSYKMLNQKYCYINQNFEFFDKHDNIIIRHYNGRVKPWHLHPDNETSLMPNLKDFWHYAEMTDFYEELYQKTQNTAEQKMLIRKLKVSNIMLKSKLKK